MTEEQERELDQYNKEADLISSVIFPMHIKMYKCIEEDKDYLEADLKDAPDFAFTDEEFQKLNEVVDAI